jgi:hypothetical protein
MTHFVRFHLLLLLSTSMTLAQPSSMPRDDFWVPDGPVNAVVETNGVIYIGGLFGYVSPNSGTGGAFDLLSGAPVPRFPRFAGAIKTIVPDNAGGWFVGGSFASVDGFPIANLAHVSAKKVVDTNWIPNPDGAVLALVSSSSMLYVGGNFSTIAGQPRSALAALDPVTGGALAGWQADVQTGDLPTRAVTSLVLSEGRLYVGGNFSIINGVEREHLAAVNAATGAVADWIPNAATGAESFARVDALAISDRILFVGGTFSSLGGESNRVSRSFVAALDTSKDREASVLPWNPDANGPVSSIAVSCDTVFVGGSFTTIGGTNRNRIAALNIFTGRATGWNPDADGIVLKIALAGDVVYAGGKFTEIGCQPRSFLAALDIDSAQATLWNPRADSGVAGLAVSGGAVVAGGAFSPGGKARKNVAAFDARTGKLLDWNPSITGSRLINAAPYEGVEVMVARSNTLYLGGYFSFVSGQPRSGLAAVDGATGALEPWDPNPDGVVKSLAASEDAIYVGGLFASIGGQSRTNIAALYPVTGNAAGWNPAANDKVAALSVSGTTVYAGGLFTEIAGMPRRRLAALDADSGAALSWDPNANNQVSALVASDARVYLGGHFSKIGAVSVNRIAAVNATSGELDCWRPDARRFDNGAERSAAINAIIVSGDAVYAGGTFSVIGGLSRRNLAVIDTACPGTATAWDPGLDAPVKALAAAGSSIVAGGLFQNIGGTYHPNLAVFPPLGSPTIVVQPRGQLVAAGQAVNLQAAASGEGVLSYQWQLNGTNLPGATAPSLLIASAQISSSGDYTLVVTNRLGLINSRLATVTVVEPVTILVQPVSQTVPPGADVTLSVAASGNPPPTFQWRLNGTDIPGAVRPTLTVSNVQPTDGGNYSVVVASVGGVVSSEIATLLVTSPDLGFRDNLANRLMIIDASGLGSGNNLDATNETHETNHVGKLGGRSVWLGWIAPVTGIATFSTRGSSFDTLLGIYTGADVGNLTALAADEDSGGFLTSQASFNAVAGTEYLIAVDGFGGASGNIVLRWSLDTSTVPFPRILTQPISMTVNPGAANAEFFVTVDNPTNVTYQWFHECRVIEGATNRTFTIASVQVADVGRYHVEVRNASTQTARSFDASLDIGPDLKVISYDKLEDLLGASSGGQSGAPFRAAVSFSGFLSVAVGNIDSQSFNNSGSTTQPLETNHCAVLGGASKWLGLEAMSDGVLIIDTIGSAIDTVMAVYYPTNLAYLSSALVTCDNDGAPDGIRSLVSFQATRDTKYLVVVDGVNRAQGAISINCKLGMPPPPATNIPAALTVRPGANLTLTANTTNGLPAPAYHWLLNGTPIAGATGRVFTSRNVQLPQAGTYSVIVSNLVGITFETNAMVTMAGPLRLLGLGFDSNGHYQLSVNGSVSPGFILEATTNFGDLTGAVWTSLLTNSAPRQSFLFLDSNAPFHPGRFYRAKDVP